jgi:hypothetical protein
MIEERRGQARIEVFWPAKIDMGGRSVNAETRNITTEGVSILCDEPLEIDERYKITITAPNQPEIEITARVVWSDLYGFDENNKSVGMGLCFGEASGKDKAILKKAVSAHK